MTPNDSLKPTAEQLMQWKEAGVLFETPSLGMWYGPLALISLRSGIRPYLMSDMFHRDTIRPYRAPGVIQPHDGDDKKPEHVRGADLIIARSRMVGTWWGCIHMAHRIISWEDIEFYIVLPRGGG